MFYGYAASTPRACVYLAVDLPEIKSLHRELKYGAFSGVLSEGEINTRQKKRAQRKGCFMDLKQKAKAVEAENARHRSDSCLQDRANQVRIARSRKARAIALAAAIGGKARWEVREAVALECRMYSSSRIYSFLLSDMDMIRELFVEYPEAFGGISWNDVEDWYCRSHKEVSGNEG